MTDRELLNMTRACALRVCNSEEHHGCPYGDVSMIDCVERLDADYEAMIDRLISLGESSKWISTKDYLPEVGKIVLVHQEYSWERGEDGAAVTIGRLRPVPPGQKPHWEFQYYRPDFRSGSVMDNDIICPGSEYVTHWRPLPEPPEGL